MGRYPLLLMLALLGLASLLAWWWPASAPCGTACRLGGSALMLCGGALILVAAGLFRRRGTTLDPTRAPDVLVVDGLYRLSRNPMYLGMLLVLAGYVVLLDAWPGLLLPLGFFCFMNWWVIPREERAAEGAHGAAYHAYKARTRRWI
jgi:protein-S-isoprenylcysteine O-methyltransferase Ste14